MSKTDERLAYAKDVQLMFPITEGGTIEELFKAILDYNQLVQDQKDLPVPPKNEVKKVIGYNRLVRARQIPPLVKIITVIHSFGMPVNPNPNQANLFTSAMQLVLTLDSDTLGSLYVAVISFMKDVLDVSKMEIKIAKKAISK